MTREEFIDKYQKGGRTNKECDQNYSEINSDLSQLLKQTTEGAKDKIYNNLEDAYYKWEGENISDNFMKYLKKFDEEIKDPSELYSLEEIEGVLVQLMSTEGIAFAEIMHKLKALKK
jgi:hypothetical protein